MDAKRFEEIQQLVQEDVLQNQYSLDAVKSAEERAKIARRIGVDNDEFEEWYKLKRKELLEQIE